MSGYVRIHRTLIGHPAFRNDAEAMAFAWMVMRAAWKPIRVRYKERGIHLERGQLAVSVRDFAAAHERNKNWVSRILQRMRDEGMIETSAGTGVLVITICNYDQYQSDGQIFETAQGTQQGTRAGQTRDTEQRREEIKNEKKEAIASCLRIAFPAPDGVSDEQWAAFRQQRKKPLNQRSYTLLTNKLLKLAAEGHAPGELIDLAIERGWETVFAPKEFGGKPVTAKPAGAKWDELTTAEKIQRTKDSIAFYSRINKPDEVEQCRRRLAQLEGGQGPPQLSNLVRQVAEQRRVG